MEMKLKITFAFFLPTFLLFVTSCQPHHFSDPVEALSVPTGYRIEGNNFSEILQQQEILQGKVFLYFAESYHTENKGDNCLVLTYVVNERKGWRSHLSLPLCDSQTISSVARQGNVGHGLENSQRIVFGYNERATRATVVWDNQHEETVALQAHTLLLPFDDDLLSANKVLFYDDTGGLIDTIEVGN